MVTSVSNSSRGGKIPLSSISLVSCHVRDVLQLQTFLKIHIEINGFAAFDLALEEHGLVEYMEYPVLCIVEQVVYQVVGGPDFYFVPLDKLPCLQRASVWHRPLGIMGKG